MKRISLALLLFACLCPALSNAQANRDPWVYAPGSSWDMSWNARPNPRAGACFYTKPGFGGNHFCVRRGDRLDRLPGKFGDNLSSIRLFGATRVTVFNDRNFSGGSAQFNGNVNDLRNRPFRNGQNWNNRVSSLMVR